MKACGAAIHLPRIGWLRGELRFAGEVASVTVLRKACRWFAAVTVETGEDPPAQRADATIGVDVGVKTFADQIAGLLTTNSWSSPSSLKYPCSSATHSCNRP